MSSSKSLGFLAGILAMIIGGLIPTLTKLGVSGIPTSEFLVVRYGISTLLLLPILRSLSLKKILRDKALLLFMMTVALYLSCFTFALKSLPASWYILLFSIVPVASLFFLGLRISLASTTCSLLGIAGALCFLSNNFTASFQLLPFLALLTSIAAWISITLQMKKFHSRYSDLQITAVGNLATFISSIPLWLLTGAELAPLGSTHLLMIVLLAVLVPMNFFLFSFAVRSFLFFGVTAQYLKLVFGLLFAVAIFKEPFNRFQITGTLLVIAALSGFTKLKEAPRAGIQRT